MGYKLAGFDVIGCNEIDPRMNKVYVANHHPRFNYLAPIQEFKLRKDLPAELYNLDILDGSPPCSSFSTVGAREEGWGKKKKFREGQAEQVLDTLFFDFIDLAKELQPKVVIAENVEGLLIGEAMDYVRRIYAEFDAAGYHVQHWLLEASKMGVPQMRPRVFFLCLRKDISEPFMYQKDMFERKPYINMDFNEKEIPIGDFADFKGKELTGEILRLWKDKRPGEYDLRYAAERLKGKQSFFGHKLLYLHRVCNTITAGCDLHYYDKPLGLSESEIRCIATFPQDYDFLEEKAEYICGMSVPPVMMAQVASRVYEQWLSKIPE